MTDPTAPDSHGIDFDDLHPDAMLRVNRICDDFESRWKEAPEPSFADFVSQYKTGGPLEATVLARELIAIDVQHRRQSDLHITPSNYAHVSLPIAPSDLPQFVDELCQASPAVGKRTLQPGDELGDYRIHSEIGCGGMGQVYRATHTLMGRTVAIKVMRSHVQQDSSALRRFEREVQSVAKLSHPNIVTAFDARRQDDSLYLVTEWIDGQDLAQHVANHPAGLPWTEAAEHTRQTALGLHYAHQMGVIHRDVKPNNLLREPCGRIKVLDLGLAKLLVGNDSKSQALSRGLTQATQIIGTPAFMSPEQARSPISVGPTSDIYSLGCTLYFLLVGRPPYSGLTDFDTIVEHVSSDLPAVVSATKPIPKPLQALVRRMLAKNPADRPQSMQDVADQLARIQSVSSSVSISSNASPVLLQRALIAVGLAVVLLAAVWARQFTAQAPDSPSASDSPSKTPTSTTASSTDGILFDGLSNYGQVADFSIAVDGPVMMEVLVTPQEGTFPANVATWSGKNCLVLFAGPNHQWGVAFLYRGVPLLLVAKQPIIMGQPCLLAARYDGGELQLMIDGVPIRTYVQDYALYSTAPTLCFGGLPPGLLPKHQGTRYFAGTLHHLRLTHGDLPSPATTPAELLQSPAATVAQFTFPSSSTRSLTDTTDHHWQAELH